MKYSYNKQYTLEEWEKLLAWDKEDKEREWVVWGNREFIEAFEAAVDEEIRKK